MLVLQLRRWLATRLGTWRVALVALMATSYCLVLGIYTVSNYHAIAGLITKSQRRDDVADRREVVDSREFAHFHLTPLHATEDYIEIAPPVEDLDSISALLAERTATAQRACARYTLSEDYDDEPNAREFLVDQNHHLVWCNLFKVASTTLFYYFNLLGGYSEYQLKHSNKPPLTLARARFPRPSVQELRSSLSHSLSFLVVREPFERLLSAFRDKVENTRHRFYRKLARDVVARREGRRSRFARPTFPEFAAYVVSRARGAKSRFNRFDEHWAPYHSFCTPCQVNFTVIAKLETFERDRDYIVWKAGIGDVLGSEVTKRQMKSVENKAKDGRNTASLVKKYYSQLTMTQLQDLYEIYKIDFEMFGYDARKYFLMLKNNENQNISSTEPH